MMSLRPHSLCSAGNHKKPQQLAHNYLDTSTRALSPVRQGKLSADRASFPFVIGAGKGIRGFTVEHPVEVLLVQLLLLPQIFIGPCLFVRFKLLLLNCALAKRGAVRSKAERSTCSLYFFN